MATKKERKIALLKKAKIVLINMPLSSRLGICYCIQVVPKNDLTDYEAGRDLKAYIMRVLKGNFYLDQWMRKQGIKTSDKSVRSARSAWIDWMIASLEGKN